MRIFVTYKTTGEITTVSKVETMPEGLVHPYSTLEEGEAVLEVPAEGDVLNLDALQIHEQFKLSVANKKLVKKT